MALMFGDTATVILLVAIHVYLVHSRFLSDSAFLNAVGSKIENLCYYFKAGQ
uniref:Uncharacterized protein n=1 Tax=Octopus bimaculoides TaxID=37653 RepID=A0A0L8IBR7_OCTBM